jgi:hypothetical protein
MSQAEVNRIVAVGKARTANMPAGNFYSWGGDNHRSLTLGGRDELLFHSRYNQAVGGGSNAGPGLYVTTSLFDSAEYCPGANGVLLQVEMPDGMPYVSVTDPVTMNDLRTGNPRINTAMIYRQSPDIPPVLVHFAGNWHALKTTKGVGFRLFDGRGSNATTIQAGLDRLRQDGRAIAAGVLLAQLRDDIRAQVH